MTQFNLSSTNPVGSYPPQNPGNAEDPPVPAPDLQTLSLVSQFPAWMSVQVTRQDVDEIKSTGIFSPVMSAGLSAPTTPGMPLEIVMHQLVADFCRDGPALQPLLQQSMQTYLKVYNRQSPHFDVLLRHCTADQLEEYRNGTRIYGDVDPAILRVFFTHRDMANIRGKPLFTPEQNWAVQYCPGSWQRMPGAESHIGPEQRASYALTTLINRGTIKEPCISPCRLVALTAPALDSTDQPEYNIYVQAGGRLDTTRYATSLVKSASHFLAEASQVPHGTQIVLSAYGTGAFLAGLQPAEKTQARTIAVHKMVELVQHLQAQGHDPQDIVFSDASADSGFWQRVNWLLQRKGASAVSFAGAWPVKEAIGTTAVSWLRPEALLLIAADDNANLGNNGLWDYSQDGFVNSHTLAHFQHTLSSAKHNLDDEYFASLATRAMQEIEAEPVTKTVS